MTGRRSRDQNGSLVVELVVIAPVLFILAIAILAFGRVSEARQQIVEASRASAEVGRAAPQCGQRPARVGGQ